MATFSKFHWYNYNPIGGTAWAIKNMKPISRTLPFIGPYLQGQDQQKEGENILANSTLPEFPKLFREQLDIARRNASQTKYAGQTLDEQNANQTMERAMRQTQETSPNQIAAAYGMGNIAEQRATAQENFGRTAAQNWQQNQQILGRELDKVDQNVLNAWEWEKGNPYLKDQMKGASFQASGLLNQNNAVNSLTSTLVNAASLYATGGMSAIGGPKSQTNNTTQQTVPTNYLFNNWSAGAKDNQGLQSQYPWFTPPVMPTYKPTQTYFNNFNKF
jgi:hypothetical protein